MKVSIIGGRGYMGGELIRLLLNHPDVEISDITSSSVAGERVADHFPHLHSLGDMVFSEYSPEIIGGEIVFLALPHTLSMKYVRELLDAGKRVIDLSGDFRINDSVVYENWYGVPHESPELLEKAVYGLPELHREKIKSANLVASPGCYPTSIILATAPAIAEEIGVKSIIANSVSGVSGAGRALSPPFHFPEMNEEMFAYKVLTHRHTPEITQEMSRLHGGYLPLVFTPHVAPFTRGIYSTVYLTGEMGINMARLIALYTGFYKDSPFVKILKDGEHPKLSSVTGSNLCKIALFKQSDDCIIVISVIDNLIKGGSGQAVQTMNLMTGKEETTALMAPPPFP